MSKGDETKRGCCCSGGESSTCCGPALATERAEGEKQEKQRLDIEFLYLDLDTCTRCQGTETSLDDAIAEVGRVLQATGTEVSIRKIHVQSEEQARELRFVSSPTIRVNGRDIQLEVKESLCESCGDICGGDVDCRVWVYQGKEYASPPKALVIDAILREVYGGPGDDSDSPAWNGDIPENLKRFFAALRHKENGRI